MWYHLWKGDQPRLKRHLCLEEERVFPPQYIYEFWELLGVLEKRCSQKCKKRDRLKSFLYHRKFIFCSQNSRVFAFLTIPLFSKSMMPWWVLVHETGGFFKYIFWTTTGHDQRIWDTFWLNHGHWYKVLNFYQLLYQFKIRVKIIFVMSLENDNSLTLWKSHIRRTK